MIKNLLKKLSIKPTYRSAKSRRNKHSQLVQLFYTQEVKDRLPLVFSILSCFVAVWRLHKIGRRTSKVIEKFKWKT